MTGVLAPRVSPGRAPEHGLLRAWMVSVSLGEFAGFCVPALAGGLLREAPPLLVLGAVVLAGSVEGAVLGWSQARVLRHRLDGFNTPRWIGATALAAAGAWLLGMLPSTFHDQWSTWPTLVTVLVAVLVGTLLLVSIGLAQWTELRRHLPRASWWVVITAVSWGAGLGVFTAVATPLWHPGQSTVTVIAVGVLAGALMAVTMAGLTGWGLRHLVVQRAPVRHPWRRTFVVGEELVALAGAAGSAQLLAGVATPPDSALDPFERFGVTGWGLPAVWLFATVAAPSGLAAWSAWRRSARTPALVLGASALLALELLVQIPFLGLSVMQAVSGAAAVTLGVLGWDAAASGGWRTRPSVPTVSGPAGHVRAA